MSGYTLTGVETTLIIERSETNLNPVISSLDDSYMYIHPLRALETPAFRPGSSHGCYKR